MPRIVLAQVGTKDGLAIYSAMSADDIKAIAAQSILVVDMKSGKAKRTGVQNASIHLYLTWLVDAFNSAGLDMISVMAKLSKNAKIPWSLHAAKERLWAPTQKSTYGTESTTQLDTDQVSVVYEALNGVTTEQLGVGVNFPDKMMRLYEEDLNREESQNR